MWNNKDTRLFGSDNPRRVFPVMPLKINSGADEVNGALVWVLTAAASPGACFRGRALVSGPGAARLKQVSVLARWDCTQMMYRHTHARIHTYTHTSHE